ncbi:MAG: molybdopterin-dependent oxidoreductase [Halioglobus sp.]
MRTADPELTYHPTVCPLDCADTCSMTVGVKHGKVQEVRGSDVNPFTRGKICAKVANGLVHQVHGPDRLTQPLRRTGPKEDGAYEAISWDVALDEIYSRFQHIIEQFGPQAIAPLTYGGPMGLLGHGSMANRFFNRLGASQVDSSPLCAGVSGLAWETVFGDAGGIPYTELAESKLIVVWGNNITVAHLHLIKVLREARAKGAKLVVIDPKRIRIADEADLYLPVLPGTDVVLAYAVAAELARQGALNQTFIDQHVTGAEAFLAEAEKYPLAKAADICGLELADIQQFVAMWRDIAPAAISMGVAPERNRNGGGGIRAAFALPVLTGNIGPVGAGVCDVSGFYPVEKDQLKRPDLIPEGTREFSVLEIPERILSPGSDTPVKGVFIYNHNPIAVHPQARKMQQALMSEDLFVVGSDVSMTDSMACADIILPASTHLEYGDLYKSYGHHYLQRTEAAIAPVGESVPNMELFRRLAARFGFTEPCFSDTDEQMIDMAISSDTPALEGRNAMALSTHEAVDMSVGNTDSLLRGALPDTPSGKIELYSAALEHECGEGLPRYRALDSTRGFILVSPASEKRTNSTFGGVADHDTDLLVEMHPADAVSLALVDGQTVRLFNDLGEVILPLQVSDKVRRGTLYVPKGAWLRSCPSGQSVNALIPGHTSDIGGGACYNDATVDVVAM